MLKLSETSEGVQPVLVKIFEDLDPMERHQKYGESLNAFLGRENVAGVTGGGTMGSAPDENGDGTVLFAGLDIELTDFARGLPLLRAELGRLRVPAGTALEFTRHGFDSCDAVYEGEAE